MGQDIKYDVITGEKHDFLRDIAEKFKDGWHPQGGVCVHIEKVSDLYGDGPPKKVAMYSQAMYHITVRG